MSGLVYRDLLTFYRKNTKVTYIMEAVYFLFFLLVLRNIYGAITFLVIASPISMSGLPATMKDLDTKECAKWANDAINLCYTADEVEKMVKTRLGMN